MRLWTHFSLKLKYFSILVLVLALFTSILEVVGIGSIVPIIAILSDPKIIETNAFMSFLFNNATILGVKTHQDFFQLIAISAVTLFILSIIGRAFCNYLTIKLVASCEFELSVKMFTKYLNTDYEQVITTESELAKKDILSETFMVSEHAIAPLVVMISQGLTLFFFLTTILIVSFDIAFFLLMFSSVLALLVIWPLSRLVMKLGNRRFLFNEMRFKQVNDSLSVLKEIKVRGDENYFIEKFLQVCDQYRISLSHMRGISIIPRYILEGCAIGAFLTSIIVMHLNGIPFPQIISIITLYVLFGYRALPALQNIYVSYTGVKSMLGSVEHLVQQLEKDIPITADAKAETSPKSLNLNRTVPAVIFDKVSYNFSLEGEAIIKEVDLVIPPGQCVGIIGKTGSGKTTLINLLMGLFKPTSGKIEHHFDGLPYSINSSQQLRYGYVSQNVVLVASSIAENVALSEELNDIDYDLLNKCLSIADLDQVVKGLEQGVKTAVGERGIRLSGGQKQRVAIARAIYQYPAILVLDEATSALDLETEKQIISNLRELNGDITVIMIAHRPQSLENCDVIYKLDKGKLKVHKMAK